MLFNSSKKYDFLPELKFSNGKPLEVVEEVRLLGVTLNSKLSWQAHIDSMCTRAYRRLWIIRRLKKLGATTEDLLTVYFTQIRCILEFAVAAWNASLTKAQISQLERVQKSALSIILRQDYVGYDNALTLTGLDSLVSRRHRLCLVFAKKALKNPKFSYWFKAKSVLTYNTRTKKTKLEPVQARTARYMKSPIAYLTKLLNDEQ